MTGVERVIGGNNLNKEKDKKNDLYDNCYDNLHDNLNLHQNLDSPPVTKSMSKSARNRHYAQISRARRRQYISNLEENNQMLLAQLEMIEEENRAMRKEIFELRREQRDVKQVDNHVTDSRSFKNDNHVTDSPFKNDNYSAFKNDNHNLYSISQFPQPTLNSTNYALSVLDFLFPPELFTNKTKQLSPLTNSPRPQNFQFIEPKTILVDVRGAEWREPMNWKGNCCKISKMRRRRRRGCDWLKLRLLRLVKLAKLKIYLQQFGNKK